MMMMVMLWQWRQKCGHNGNSSSTTSTHTSSLIARQCDGFALLSRCHVSRRHLNVMLLGDLVMVGLVVVTGLLMMLPTVMVLLVVMLLTTSTNGNGSYLMWHIWRRHERPLVPNARDNGLEVGATTAG